MRYRSRQEARWAIFFEWAGWEADYEPALDQALDGWLPDFVLTVSGMTCLAECKPALTHPDLEPARRKIEASGATGPIVLLGARWGVNLVRGLDRKWRPAHIVLGPEGAGFGFSVRAEPDEDVAWWLRSAWISSGNLTQWKRGNNQRRL